VFAEGTARSVRREYMTFEMTGRVTFVGPEKEGQKVKKGEVLAQLDKRKYAADVDAALASIQEAKTKAEASTADVGQAQTQYELALTQFNRIKALYNRNNASQAEYEESQAKLDNAKAAVESAKAQSLAVISQIDVADAKLRQAKVALEGAEIVSPIDGIVAYLNIEEGYYFTQSNVKTNSEAEALQSIPMVVIDPSEYEITVDVPSFEADRIAVGQQVLLLPGGTSEGATVTAINGPLDNSPASAPDWQARGEVYSVNPAVNPGGRSIQVKVRTTMGADHLRDGMFVTCWIATEDKPEAVVAPFDALLYEENRPYVFVYQPETQTVQRRDVVLGIQGLTHREILSGVKAGEMLVTDGRYRLVDGAPVRVLEPAQQPSAQGTTSVHRFDRVLHALSRPQPRGRASLDPRVANKLDR
jgi:RND family efflux transporter MFP subunit